jgi:hypothetical protein
MFYADLELLVNWQDDAREVESELLLKYPYLGTNADFVLHRENSYGEVGITWTLRAARFSPQVLPARSVFSDRGYGAIVPSERLFEVLGVLTSTTFDYLFKTFLGRHGHPEFLVGVLQRMPWMEPSDSVSLQLADLAHRGWSLRRSLDTVNEGSHAFVVPAVLQVEGSFFRERVGAWSARVADVEAELAGVQAEIDELCFELYGISEEDRRAIIEGFGVGDNSNEPAGETDDDDESVGEEFGIDPQELVAQLVSWAVGVGVGRFDLRLATGERDWPAEPDPFDPLPVCSLGMLTGDDGLPLDTSPAGYPVDTSSVLVIDPGHPLDIAARVRSVFDAVFGDDADNWWADVGQALGARGGEVSSWLAKGFFDHHLKTHSKSRRKAPILWPIGTASGSYLVWLYAHRVTSDSLFQLLHDIVAPKVALEDQRLTQLRQAAGPSPTASQRRDMDKQAGFVDELREFAQRIEAVAPLWAPDLNDGIVIVLAPIWRLFAHHRAWSTELKNHWAKLAAGHYDWATLAMYLWPERVIPKCAEDRSLAIAHNLEDVFWAQDRDSPDKWHPRDISTTPIDQLIAQHHNPAATAALEQVI